MKILNKKEAVIIYENKNTQEILVIPIYMTERNKGIIKNLFLWLQEVYDNYKDGGLPMRPFIKTSSSCKYCPVKKSCWAKHANKRSRKSGRGACS